MFPVNFVKFLRTPFFTEHLQWLCLNNIAFLLLTLIGNWLLGCTTLESYSVHRNLFQIAVKTLSNVPYGQCKMGLTTIYETFRLDEKKRNNFLNINDGIFFLICLKCSKLLFDFESS